MAKVYKKINGRPIQKAIALNDGVQDWLDDFIFEAGVRAEQVMIEHRAEGFAHIDIGKGRVDRHLILVDDHNGQNGAMSIEFGRESYTAHRGDGTEYEVDGMEGIAPLHKGVRVRLGSLRGTGGGKV